MKTCITGGLILNPATNLEQITNIYIEDGRIEFIGEKSTEGYTVIDATGKWVIPGLVDLHVHLREPGFEHKETIATGCLAAARAGITTICPMPNTNPVIDTANMVRYVCDAATVVNVIPVGAITKGQNGAEVADITGMAAAGICALSDDGKTAMNSAIMKEAMGIANSVGLPIFSHAEDMNLIGGVMNEGKNSVRFNLKGLGREAEEIIIARDMILARHNNARLHICHVSTKGGVELIEFGKKLGIRITAETAPHYFILDDSILFDHDSNKKMNPPLRTKEDVASIRAALRSGILDAIATDHAPHSLAEKASPIETAPFGIIGMETSFALSYTHLVKTGVLTPLELISKMSTTPAAIIGIDKGNLDNGKIADIAIIDVNAKYKINSQDFVSKSRNTPFEGMEVFGVVEKTLVNGQIIYENSISCS